MASAIILSILALTKSLKMGSAAALLLEWQSPFRYLTTGICRRSSRHGGQYIDAAFVAELMVVEVATANRVETVVTDFRYSFR